MTIQPGRELDAKVAEVVFGSKRPDPPDGPVSTLDSPDRVWRLSSSLIWLPKDFSTTWEGMRLVVERMRELGYKACLYHDKSCCDLFPKYNRCCFRSYGETLPHAVCLAALAAIEGEGK